MDQLCQLALKSFNSFSIYNIHNLVTNEQMNGWTDRSRILCLRRTHKNTYGIVLVCFYDAEHILSSIAKFLVHFLEEWESDAMRREGSGRERSSEEDTMEGWEMGMKEKIATKCNIFGIWGCPMGLLPTVINF